MAELGLPLSQKQLLLPTVGAYLQSDNRGFKTSLETKKDYAPSTLPLVLLKILIPFVT
jgi:hypothetical protein